MVYKKFNRFQLILALSVSIFIFLFYLLFNFNYLTKWIDEKGDCLTYDYYVRLGLPQYLYNPHHIAFDWLGLKMYNILKDNGYKGTTMVVLQLRNLIASSAGLALLFFLFYKFSKKFLLSFGIVSIIAFTSAYWIYSQINDTPIIHSVLVTLLFFASIHFPEAKHKILYSIFLGVLHSVNIFFHQYDALFTIVIFFVILFGEYFKTENLEKKNVELNMITVPRLKLQKFHIFNVSNLKYFLIYLAVFIFIVSAAYYYVGIVKIGLTLDINKAQDFNKIKNASYFFNWLILYTKIDYWGKGFTNIPDLLHKSSLGISEYFYQPQSYGGFPLAYDFKNFFSINSILPNLVGVLFIFVFLCTMVFSYKLYKKYGYIFLASLLFLIIYTIFSFWWEPDYREFWIATMFAFWILLFLLLDFIIENFKILKPLPSFFIYSFIFLFSILLFYFNFTGFIYPNAGNEFRKFDIIAEKVVK